MTGNGQAVSFRDDENDCEVVTHLCEPTNNH